MLAYISCRLPTPPPFSHQGDGVRNLFGDGGTSRNIEYWCFIPTNPLPEHHIYDLVGIMIGTTNSESQKSIALPSRLRGKKLDLSTTVSWQIMCLLLLPTDCLWSEPDIKFIVSPDSPEI